MQTHSGSARRHWRLFVAGMLAVTATARGSAGQSLDSSMVNRRIRADLVTTETMPFRGSPRVQPVIGRFGGVRDGHLLLVVAPNADTLRLPQSSIRAIHLSRGRTPRWESALRRGLTTGFVAGVLTGLQLSIARNANDPTPMRGALTSAASSGAIGIVIGGALPPERWRRISDTGR